MAKTTSLTMFLSCIFIIFASFCAAGRSEMDEDQLQVTEFDVKPGGMEQTYQTKMDGFVCKFTYVCQGGTSEKWLVGLSWNKKQTQYSCSVERSGGLSYLFFQEFSVEVTGAQLELVDLESEHGAALKPSEYLVDYDNSKVYQVNGEFQSKLSRVEVFASHTKEEL